MIKAKRVDLNFRPLQSFSRNIRIQEVAVIEGDIQFEIDPSVFNKKTSKKTPLQFSLRWDQLFQVRAESISIQNTRIHCYEPTNELDAKFTASILKVSQWVDEGVLGYELDLALKDIHSHLPKEWTKTWRFPSDVELLELHARANSLGIQNDKFKISAQGVDLEASGKIQGNISSLKNLETESVITADFNFKEAVAHLNELFPGFKLPKDIQGQARFKGKLHGFLDRPMETFKLGGELEAQNAQFQGWKAQTISSDLLWVVSKDGGEISVKKLEIQAREEEGSGQVALGPVKFRPTVDEVIQVPILFQKAHSHWLGAGFLNRVYPLKFVLSGPAQVKWSADSKKNSIGNLQAHVDFSIDRFLLDNQKLGKVRPLKKILEIPHLYLKGDLLVDAHSLRPNGVEVGIDQTRFSVSGKVDFKNGLDLKADGPVNLAEINTVAEIAIRGEGRLATSVHGPFDRVVLDFDTDLKNAEYVRLKLGGLRGRISYDDGPTHVRFSEMEGTLPHTRYLGGGVLDLGAEPETIQMDIDVPEGRVEDLIPVFSALTKKISWFPQALVGQASGKIKIRGGIDMNTLEIGTDLKGLAWEYWGEKFKWVELQGGYKRGTYYLTNSRAFKRAGEIIGRVSYDDQERLDWELSTQGVGIQDFDWIARLDVPIRGDLNIVSRGKGKMGAIDSFTQSMLNRTTVRGTRYAPSELTLRSSSGIAKLVATALGGQGSVALTYDSKPGAPCSLKAEAIHLDFSPILMILNTKNMQDRLLTGLISGGVDVQFKSGQADLFSGSIAISEYTLAKTGVRFQLKELFSVKATQGSFDIQNLNIKGNEGELALSLFAKNSKIKGVFRGKADAGLLEFFAPPVAQARGVADVEVQISGELSSPQFEGRAVLEGVRIKPLALETPVENIVGRIQLKQNLLTFQKIEGDLANGRVFAAGSVGVYSDRFPVVDLTLRLAGNRLKIFPFQYVKVMGQLRVHGEQLPYLIDGEVQADSALIREKILGTKQLMGTKSAQYLPPPKSLQESDYPKFKLQIFAQAERGILIQNDLFDAEMKGDVTLVNTLEAPRVLGKAELVQGKMIFKDRTFQIQSADISFDNPAVMNPKFNLSAQTEVNNVKVQLFSTGRLDNYKIDLSSNPAMSETEIISLLALGLGPEDLKRMRAGGASTFEQGEAASLLLHSLDFNRDVEDRTGFKIQLDEAINSQTGNSAFRTKQDTDNPAAPKIVIKRQIGKKVDLSVGSTVGVGGTNQKQVNAEVRVTPGLSVIGVLDNQDSVDNQERTSYGIDLKLQKRFK